MSYLILFFDVNGTIIAQDTVQNKDREVTLLQELAKKYTAKWREDLPEPITYAKFVRHYLLQGDEKSNLILKRQRQQKYAEFLGYLQSNHAAIYEQVLADFTQLQDMLSQAKGQLFPSFLYLLQNLKKQEVSFTLVLRSFGNDIPAIVKELKDHDLIITHLGYFKGQELHINDQKLTKPAEILSTLQPGVHQAWRDDWPYWHTHHQEAAYGKPFYVSKSNPVTLFFDDKAFEKDIINSQHVNGQSIEKAEAIQAGYLVAVDTLGAIRDKGYFWQHVQKFL